MDNRGGRRQGSGRKCKNGEPRVQFSCLLSERNRAFILQQADTIKASNSDIINKIIDTYILLTSQ